MKPDVLIANTIGPPGFDYSTKAIGGSELEILQVADALARRGHKVAVANMAPQLSIAPNGVTFVPANMVEQYWPTKALFLERMTPLPERHPELPPRVVVRVTDRGGSYVDPHCKELESGRFALAGVTNWHVNEFHYARERIVINPMLGPTPPTEKTPGRFIYASAPMKGLDATLAKWRELHQQPRARGGVLKKAKLVIVTPGFHDFYGDKTNALSDADKALGVSYAGSPPLEEYRALIASAEGLFHVSRMAETFMCAAALAERSGTRTHILCLNGKGGIPEAITNHYLLTENGDEFFDRFFEAWQSAENREKFYADPSTIVDRSPEALAVQWERALHLESASARVPEVLQPAENAERAEHHELYVRFKAALMKLGEPEGNVTSYWRERAAAQAEFARTKPAEDFLTWSDDVDMHELGCFAPWWHALRASPEWERWYKLSRKAKYGKPHAFSLDPGTSPVGLQHVYHLMRYEQLTGKRFLDGIDTIVEVGGGYGNFARMLREDGFRGTHVIIDLPQTREFQKLYLQLNGVSVSTDPTSLIEDGVTLLLEHDIADVLSHLQGHTSDVAFVATWSLSETPIEFRTKLFPALYPTCCKYLMATQWPQHHTDGIPNDAYFTMFMKDATTQRPDLSWRTEVVEHHTGSRYLFAAEDLLPARAGTHVCHYSSREGDVARLYWGHDRVLIGGTINEWCKTKLEDLGVTHVLSAEHEHDDNGFWPDDRRARFSFPDDGRTIDGRADLMTAMDFASDVLRDPKKILYTHCRLGGSRGPSMGYLALRAGFGLSHDRALEAIRQTRGEWWPHKAYIESIDRAYEQWLARRGVTMAQPAAEPTPPQRSIEQSFGDDPTLATNKEHLGPFFGDFLSLLRGAIAPGGSELGLGLSLFSLAVSTRASNIVEIGRFKGFSTLALAAACHLMDAGWKECRLGEQRPDVNYLALKSPRQRRVISIDPSPTAEADDLIARANLTRYVEKIDRKSEMVQFSGPIDLLLIDGSHAIADIRKDVQRFVPWVRPGGYFVMHDYYGWFDADGNNGSPVAKVISEDLTGFDRILIDTGYASLVVFRKTKNLIEAVDLETKPEKVAPRSDGRPTVGLVIIAKGDEASTVIARAIVSSHRLVDATTVVCDASKETADVARHLGADVHIRSSPQVDWNRDLGVIAQARNEAIRIAEHKTDYVLMVDPDDYYEGSIPNVLDKDHYELSVHDAGLLYPRPQLWRSGLGYRFDGVRHEYLVAPPGASAWHIESLRYIRSHSAYGWQDQDPPHIKYMKHARDLEISCLLHPNNARSRFYLARSYHDAGRGDEAIANYEKRIAMPVHDDERYYSAFSIGQILYERAKDPTAAYLRAYEIQPHRCEALVRLAQWHRDERHKNYATAYQFAKRAAEIQMPRFGGIFLRVSDYVHGALAEWAICAFWAGHMEEALKVFEEVLKRVPPQEVAWAEAQIAMCQQRLRK